MRSECALRVRISDLYEILLSKPFAKQAKSAFADYKNKVDMGVLLALFLALQLRLSRVC